MRQECILMYTVVQHSWGFEVRNLDLQSTVATYRREIHKSFSECRVLASALCDQLNGGAK